MKNICIIINLTIIPLDICCLREQLVLVDLMVSIYWEAN